MSLCPFWPSYVPFRGVMLCKNGQKLLKINISCMSVFFKNYIVLWNMFSRAHFQHFIAIVSYFGPFQGVMLCKNGPKILKINISCIFWPNIVWKLFYYIILWHLFTRAYFQHLLSFGAGRGTIARRTCFAQSCSIRSVRKWHFRFFPKKSRFRLSGGKNCQK